MKKYALPALTVLLVATMFAGCRRNPGNTNPTTVPTTVPATVAPTARPTQPVPSTQPPRPTNPAPTATAPGTLPDMTGGNNGQNAGTDGRVMPNY